LLTTSAKLQWRNSAARRDSIMRGRKISKYSMIGDTSAHDHEYDEVRWVAADEARRLLSFDTYREILDRALAAASEAA